MSQKRIPPEIMRAGALNILLLIFLLPAAGLFPGELDDAMGMERSGNTDQAILIYQRWLDNHAGNSRFGGILLHTASLHTQPLDALETMKRYLPSVNKNDSAMIMSRIAGVESSLGLLRESSEHFLQASQAGGRDSARWLYESLCLRFVMGEYAGVRRDSLALIQKVQDPYLRDNAAALAALSLAYRAYGEGSTENVIEARDEINRYINKSMPVHSPLIWFAAYRIAQIDGNIAVLNRSGNALDTDFPSSVISYIVDAKLPEWQSPSSQIFRQQKSTADAVQVAAFGSRDTATELRVRLEDDGFISWIEQNREMWRVFVHDLSGDAVQRLKSSGYESLF